MHSALPVRCALLIGSALMLVSGCAGSGATGRSSGPPLRTVAEAPAPAPRAPVATTRAALAASAAARETSYTPAKTETPCAVAISRDAESITLDFHAEHLPPRAVREQVRALAAYLNDKRDDPASIAAPDGHPDPATFPLRKILEGRPLAVTEDLDDGARLTLVPMDPARARDLQARVLWYAADLLPDLPLQGKVCPELPYATNWR